MPVYDYVCDQCRILEERFVSLANFDALAHNQRCQQCEGVMRKLISVPTLRTTTNFMGGSDDGFGADDIGRKKARAKAAAAGVSIEGAKFHPGLCRRGVPYDPQAWYRDEQEVRKKTMALGRCAEGAINVESPILDSDLAEREKPYRCSRETVRSDVEGEIQQVYGGKTTRAKKEALYQKYIEKHSGSAPVTGKVSLKPQ